MTDAAAQNTTSEIANDIDIASEIANEIEIIKHEVEIEDGHDITIEIADESPTEISNTIENKQHKLELEIDDESPTKRSDESPTEILKLEIDDESPLKDQMKAQLRVKAQLMTNHLLKAQLKALTEIARLMKLKMFKKPT
jgi:hypothetical protein